MTNICKFHAAGTLVHLEEVEGENGLRSVIVEKDGETNVVDLRGLWGRVAGYDRASKTVAVDVSAAPWKDAKKELKNTGGNKSPYLGRAVVEAKDLTATGMQGAHRITKKGNMVVIVNSPEVDVSQPLPPR